MALSLDPRGKILRMNDEIEVDLPEDVLAAIDSVRGEVSRFDFLGPASKEAIKHLGREALDAHDAAIYAKFADELNVEALDSLEYQADWEEMEDCNCSEHGGIIRGMKVKTSVTLSPELIAAIEEAAGGDSRSDFLERAGWEVIKRMEREAIDAHDIAIYAKYKDELDADAEEARQLQVGFGFDEE